jgi:geranylgeranyl pyrophosphate synthase
MTAFSQPAALPVHSDVYACKFGLAFQIADDILD